MTSSSTRAGSISRPAAADDFGPDEIRIVTSYFITRHRGARRWALSQGIEAVFADSLDPDSLQSGDEVMGVVPIHLAAEICRRGARYRALVMDLGQTRRGRSLTVDEMEAANARLIRYDVVERQG